MKPTLSIETRKEILFAASAADYRAAMKALLKKDDAQVAADIAIDLQSALVDWKLANYLKDGSLKQSEIDADVAALLAIVEKKGENELLEAAKAEAKEIAASATREMCKKWFEGEINTTWGHDYASGLSFSIRRGARWVTSNPCKIEQYHGDKPEMWKAMMAEIRSELPNATPDEMVLMSFVKVCAESCREMRPIWEATKGAFGFVCVQVSPLDIENVDAMVKEADFWYAAFQKELGVEDPNIVFKIPANDKGLKVAEELMKRNYRLCITLNFTVLQHEAFAKLLQNHSKDSFHVLMGGFLDDAVYKELDAKGVADAKEISTHAAEAVIRRSHANLTAKGYTKGSIMTAAVRGPWSIQNSLADPDELPIAITTVEKMIRAFDAEPTPIKSVLKQPTEDKWLKLLSQSSVFNAAYAMPGEGELTMENIINYKPMVNVLTNFQDAYRKLYEYVKE